MVKSVLNLGWLLREVETCLNIFLFQQFPFNALIAKTVCPFTTPEFGIGIENLLRVIIFHLSNAIF